MNDFKGDGMISADLGQQLESFISQMVATGRYRSESEVLQEGVRIIQDREARLAALDTAVEHGLEDADSSHTMPADMTFDRLERKYRGLGEKG